MGNNMKSLKPSLEGSLRKLRTTYIDIFYVHFWDLPSAVEEIMDGLHNLVVTGKVLYLGISDSPAWFVVKANEYAKGNGKHRKALFLVFQAAYSVTQRDIEREILPMCRHEGIALTLFQVLAGGHIRTDTEEQIRRTTGERGRQVRGPWERNEDEKKMCAALEVVAEQVGVKHVCNFYYSNRSIQFSWPVNLTWQQLAHSAKLSTRRGSLLQISSPIATS
ncbi:NADP-dependent oxidoreductase domain-containing protein [Mycena capillaripes]|nr:NADP-dependent oxidoreductase domain-containing protein [Mycena capillaripes]